MNASLVPDDVVPKALDWISIAGKGTGQAFTMRPEMPDRPVVAKPETRVIIPGGERVTYYCLLPVWVQFQLGGGDEKASLQFSSWATRTLSDTWFGDHAGGVLAYALAFPAEREWSELPIAPHHVVVPVRIENESVEHLAFERLCLRTRYLSIFAAGRVLWSNSIRVVYNGPTRESSLFYGTEVPPEAGNAYRVTGPKEQATRSVVGVTFSSPSSNDFRSQST